MGTSAPLYYSRLIVGKSPMAAEMLRKYRGNAAKLEESDGLA